MCTVTFYKYYRGNGSVRRLSQQYVPIIVLLLLHKIYRSDFSHLHNPVRTLERYTFIKSAPNNKALHSKSVSLTDDPSVYTNLVIQGISFSQETSPLDNNLYVMDLLNEKWWATAVFKLKSYYLGTNNIKICLLAIAFLKVTWKNIWAGPLCINFS